MGQHPECYQESFLKSCKAQTRMSPSSTSSQTSYLSQGRKITPTMTGSCPGGGNSSLLQERLRERDAERRKSIHFGDRGAPGSPLRSSFIYDDGRPNSSGLGSKGMGVKQWEEQTSTLHKQNYNLKLELFHRRDRQSKLEVELAAAQKTIEEQAEYQEMNDMLMVELDRRDQAVDEAINLITCLEEQIELLREENQRLRQGRNSSERCETNDNDSKSSQQQLNHCQKINGSPPLTMKVVRPRPLTRVPSFLSENSEGTEALRSLYTKYKIPSDSNLTKLEEDDDEGTRDAIDSPRLSVLSRLSESSFISIYGDKHVDEDKSSPGQVTKDNNSSVLNWIEKKSPVPSSLTPMTPPLQKTEYSSLDQVIKSNSHLHSAEKISPQTINNLVVNTQTQKHNHPDYTRFEDRQNLPPTPDTFCTGKLRADSRTSNEILLTKELTDNYTSDSHTSFPARSQSECETITSHLNSHSWDSPSETDRESVNYTENSSTRSRPSRVKTPLLFNFNGSDWERDVVYSKEPTLSYQYHLSFASINSGEQTNQDNPLSELYGQRQLADIPINSHVSESSEDTDKRRESHVTNKAPESPVNINFSPVWKRNPISLTIARFRRSEQSTATHQASNRIKPTVRAHSVIYDRNMGNNAATPPPISRRRDVTPSFRPSSVELGTGPHFDTVRNILREKREERQRRVSMCNSGSTPPREVQFIDTEREEENSGAKSVRKWLGLGAGRANIMKKT